MSTPAATPTDSKRSAALTVASPVNIPTPASSADARTTSIFAKHKPFLVLLAVLTVGTLLWKGKVAAVVAGSIATALYTGYCWINGRVQQSASSAK